jgi:hypothetical protein
MKIKGLTSPRGRISAVSDSDDAAVVVLDTALSFINFFYYTHRAASIETRPAAAMSLTVLSERDLIFVEILYLT